METMKITMTIKWGSTQKELEVIIKSINTKIGLKGIKIKNICCNEFVLHFLSDDGLVYTMGVDKKKYGLLGMGEHYE